MKRFFSNRGSMLFITVISLAMAMLCFSTISLVASVKTRINEHSLDLYNTYTYESYCKIITDEALKALSNIEASMNYTPLADTTDLQSQLQEVILKKYSERITNPDLLPISITSETILFKVSMQDLDIVLSDNLNLQRTSLVDLPAATVSVTIDDMCYSTTISGMRLIYTFSNNKIYCKYSLEQASKSTCRLDFI